GVALAVRRLFVKAMIPLRPECRIVFQLMLLCLEFLNAHHIGVLQRQPVEKTLAIGRTDTIGVKLHHPHMQTHWWRKTVRIIRKAARTHASTTSKTPPMQPYTHDLLDLARRYQALTFGEY